MDSSKIYTKEGLLNVINALPLAISVIDRSRKVAQANKMTDMFVNKNEAELIGQIGGQAFDCSDHDDVPEGCGFGPECLRCKLRETVMSTLQNRKAFSMVETTMSFKTAGQRDLRISTLPMTIDREDAAFLGIEDATETKILPVIDLRLRFEMTEIEYTERTCIIVVEIAAREAITQIGIVVDAVSEVLNIKAGEIEDPPVFGCNLETNYILGIAKMEGSAKILLDIDRVLSPEDMDVLKKAA